MELSQDRNAAMWGEFILEEGASRLEQLSEQFPVVRAAFDSSDEDDESIFVFVEEEAEHLPAGDYLARLRSRSIESAARETAVGWILQAHEYYHFQHLTAYLAVNYLDRFLSVHRLPQANGWALQLLSVGCLSLAAKMEETVMPSLLDLQMEGSKLKFDSETVCKMELLILSALKWRLRSVTPFNFINYFAWKVDPSGIYAGFLASSSAHFILSAIIDIDFLEHCPSSIAAASVFCAVDEASDMAFIEPLNLCNGLINKESITKCYKFMQQVVMKGMRGRPLILPRLSSENSSSSSSSNSCFSFPPHKKRRLAKEETSDEAE